MRLRKFLFLSLCVILLCLGGCDKEHGTPDTFLSVIEHARSGSHPKHDGAALVPADATADELRALARKLKLHDIDLEVYGDSGSRVITQAFWRCLYRLSEIDRGSFHLVSLLEDEELSWDAGHSLVLRDALVRCGKAALPDLRRVTNKREWADRCIELINRGAKTAI